ncbi:MAG: hypothetical protein ACOYT4_04005 [Nanoarchaeota archaeon]
MIKKNMALLDRIMQMQSQGIKDIDIINSLNEEGISPKQINDALSQAQIKAAISQSEDNSSPINGMEQSMMPEEENHPESKKQKDQDYKQFQEIKQNFKEPEQYMPEQNQEPRQQEEYYENQGYPEQSYYPQNSLDANAITEISEQIVAEKLYDFKQKIGDIASFKNDVQDRIKDLDERLKRIENSIDKLQLAIIGKIGEFGEATSSIHNDLENLHGTVSKLMNPLVDNYKQLKKIIDKN